MMKQQVHQLRLGEHNTNDKGHDTFHLAATGEEGRVDHSLEYPLQGRSPERCPSMFGVASLVVGQYQGVQIHGPPTFG